ncbi:hypothetical protein KY092_14605 [Natronomonas gomsonensis]|jgi:uncharacterized membrane protein YheB (UPF0754 family)|uniref:DUF445 domain-containing protein n=1 Tax=Natronomonas gomsonensis TaxID=1046043 RepID=UPI0020CA778B|nr:hypothetical protein [Natronomonas gomsonensis]MCY4731787.1 hypothetical protein [Natronomonas gomsonensis]
MRWGQEAGPRRDAYPMFPSLGVALGPFFLAESLLQFGVDIRGLLAAVNLRLLLIPPITGVIGYITNWVAIRMLFKPVEFRGIDVPGLEVVTTALPQRVRQIPGMMQGRIGWQGIIPSRARKMGSISVDTGISKIASQREFYEEFDAERIAEHMLAEGSEDIHRMVEEIIREKQPQLWRDSPEATRRLVHARVSQQLPEVTYRITERIGENIDELLDIKLMVMNHLGENPELVNRIFLETGEREFDFLVKSGFIFGTLLGCFSIPLFVFIDRWWVLPVAGVFVGYFTNWLALKMIFQPMKPHEVGPFTIQGLFIRRQNEASETYASIVAEEVINLENVARNLLNGPNADRTRKMIAEELREAVDSSMGLAAPLLRFTTGPRQYDAIREGIADRGVEYAIEPMSDPEFNAERSEAIQRLMAGRMKDLPPEEFARMLRAAFKEDEWLLIGVGAALGFVAGWVQLLVVTAV